MYVGALAFKACSSREQKGWFGGVSRFRAEGLRVWGFGVKTLCDSSLEQGGAFLSVCLHGQLHHAADDGMDNYTAIAS